MNNNLFDFVTPRLATGRAITTREHVVELQAAGVSHVIDLFEEDHTALFDGTGIIAMRPRPPMLDTPTTVLSTAWFADSVFFGLLALARPKTKLLAHCRGGSNRGPIVSYALLRASGVGAADAERWIRIARPIAELRANYVADAERALKELGYT